jgi:hypothetical protein
VEARAPERISCRACASEVRAAAWIDDEIGVVDGERDRQRVGMAMGGDGEVSERPRVEGHARSGPTEHRQAGVRENDAPRFLRRRCLREEVYSSAPEHPDRCRVERVGNGSGVIVSRPGTDRGCHAAGRAIDLAVDSERPPVVVVTVGRVRLARSSDLRPQGAAGAVERVEQLVRYLAVSRVEQRDRDEQEVENEQRVCERLLGAGSIRKYLRGRLRAERGERAVCPAARLR